MTYAVGWKTETEVFLAADTAITRRGPVVPELSRERSSFGQSHFKNSEKKVEESDVKLYLKHNIGVTFAGDVGLARQMIETFFQEIEKGLAPKEALKWSISTHNPQPTDRCVKIIVGYIENNHSNLISFNSHDDHAIRADEVLIQIGSIPDDHAKFTEIALSKVLPQTIHQPHIQIASMLGIFQSYGFFDNLIEKGIGGAFGGLSIDESGGKWQPDILFIFERLLVSTCFRDDCFVVNSPIIGNSACFLGYLGVRSKKEILQQTMGAVEKGKDLRDQSKFDFVCVVNNDLKNITLIEMKKKLRHEYLFFEPHSEDGKILGTRIVRFPELGEIMNKKSFFKYVPYMEPSGRKVPTENLIKKVIKE